MLKLHLGCFNKRIPGYINVDVRAEINPEICDNAFTLEKFDNNSASVIYNSHMLEHLNRVDCKKALNRWFEVLCPGGIVRISVPDIAAISEHYVEHRNLDLLQNLLYGDQRHEFGYHYNGFDESTLTRYLREAGFIDIRRYDWRNTEHSNLDDYSQAYLPHLDKTDGKLMSLNMEATKPNV